VEFVPRGQTHTIGTRPCRPSPAIALITDFSSGHYRFELNGTDLRREPIETRKATLASLLPA